MLRQRSAAGTRVPAFYPVELVVSSGPPGTAFVAGRASTVKALQAPLEVTCPAAVGNRCVGFVKLRTTEKLGGYKRTLGKRSYALPAGSTRVIKIAMRPPNWRRIRRAGSVAAVAIARSRGGTRRTRVSVSH